MSKSSIFASWGFFMLMVALVVTPHSATAQAWPYTIAYTGLTDLGQQSRVGPSVAVDSNNMVYLAWAGTNGPGSGEAYLNIAYSTNGITFSSAMNPLSSSDWSLASAAPAIAVLNSTIYYAWTGGSNHINIAYAPTGTALSGAFSAHKSLVNIGGVTQQASGSVALAVNGSTLYLAWTGIGGNNINIASSTDGINWTKATFTYTSPYSPAVASVGGNVYLAWNANNECVYLRFTTLAGPWNCSGTVPNGQSYTYSPVLGTTGPGMANYKGLIAFSFGALPYTSGNDLFLNAISAGASAAFSNEVTPTLGVAGNPAPLFYPTSSSGNNTFVYFTRGTEIEVAAFASGP